MDGNIVAQLFPGIASFMVQDTTIAIARIALIAFGFILVDCKCKLNKIYQATISVEYTLSRKVSNSSSGL